MKRSLFVTGSTGFIGSRLIQKLNPAIFQAIYCLSRSHAPVSVPSSEYGPFHWVTGNVCEPDSYASILESCDTVIHLAGKTGKAAPDQYSQVNARGTQILVEQCERSGLKNFLFVSTIAVKYRDKKHYYYAQSKERAEEIVKNSKLNYAIVRPTIVLGKRSSIWEALSKLARKRILFMPGDGSTQIQPIYIEDLIDCLLTILDDNLFQNQIFELGGPEIVTFEKFLKRIHYLYFGKEPRVVHLPLKPLLALLSLAENQFHAALPISAGQLSAFSNDGTIETNTVFQRHVSQMKDIDQMLKECIGDDKEFT